MVDSALGGKKGGSAELGCEEQSDFPTCCKLLFDSLFDNFTKKLECAKGLREEGSMLLTFHTTLFFSLATISFIRATLLWRFSTQSTLTQESRFCT